MGGPVWTDADMLEALTLRDRGLSARQIAARMGKTKGSLVGVLHRIDTETNLSEGNTPCPHNGTMPAGWWRDGLKRQGQA